MKRTQLLPGALVIGILLVGPISYYVANIVLFGLGFVGIGPLTHYIGDTLLQGALSGFLAGLLCAAVRCRPWAAASWAGAFMLVISVSSLFYQDVQGMIAPIQYRATIAGFTAAVTATSVVGYVTSVATDRWAHYYWTQRLLARPKVARSQHPLPKRYNL